jgi:hypothetical protein
VKIAIIAALGLPLAGCFGLIAPKPLPEWAMHPQAEEIAPARQRVARRQTPRTVADRGMPDQTAAVSYRGSATPPSDIKPFGPEWTERENALDDRLRRRMHICSGC